MTSVRLACRETPPRRSARRRKTPGSCSSAPSRTDRDRCRATRSRRRTSRVTSPPWSPRQPCTALHPKDRSLPNLSDARLLVGNLVEVAVRAARPPFVRPPDGLELGPLALELELSSGSVAPSDRYSDIERR